MCKHFKVSRTNWKLFNWVSKATKTSVFHDVCISPKGAQEDFLWRIYTSRGRWHGILRASKKYFFKMLCDTKGQVIIAVYKFLLRKYLNREEMILSLTFTWKNVYNTKTIFLLMCLKIATKINLRQSLATSLKSTTLYSRDKIKPFSIKQQQSDYLYFLSYDKTIWKRYETVRKVKNSLFKTKVLFNGEITIS